MSEFVFPSIWIFVGLVLLMGGGELLVRGASALATVAKISPLVIGLTVVAFGTSAPELAVSVNAAFSGKADLAIGNVVGSNIANVLLILGLSAVAARLAVASQLIRIDVPLMIIASVVMLLMALDGTVGRVDGCLLFAGVIAYTTWLIRQSRNESQEVVAEFAEAVAPSSSTTFRILLQIAFIVVALVLLSIGSHWLVSGATDTARLLGVRELVIGLTIVAVGTSLPELVTSVVASLRGQRDIAVGNIIGSCIFNILAVLGATSILAPAGVAVSPIALRVDIPIMIAVAVACLPIFFTGHRIDRWEGGLFLGYYVAYTAYLILAATNSSVSRSFNLTMLIGIIPLTAVTLVVSTLRAARGDGSHSCLTRK